MAFLDGDFDNKQNGRPWQAWAITGIAILWLFAEAEGTIVFLPDQWAALAVWLDAASGFALPLGLLLIGWAALDWSKRTDAPDDGDASSALAALRESLQDADRTLVSLTGSAWTVQTDMAEQSRDMAKAARNLDTAATAARSAAASIETALASFDARLPDIVEMAAQAEKALTQAGTTVESQGAAIGAMLESLDARAAALQADGERATLRMSAVLREIEETSNQTTQLVADRAYALDGAVTGVLDRSVAVLDTIRESLLGHGHAIEASIKAARLEMDAVGSEAMQHIRTQMGAVVESAQALEGLLDSGRTKVEALDKEMTARLSLVESRLETLCAQSGSQLAHFAASIESVQTGNAAILDQIERAQLSVNTLHGLVSGVAPIMARIDADAETNLSEVETSVGRLDAHIAQVCANMVDLETRAAACATVIKDLTVARAAEESRFDALVDRFTAAKLR